MVYFRISCSAIYYLCPFCFDTRQRTGCLAVETQCFASMSCHDFASMSCHDFASMSCHDFASMSCHDFASMSCHDFASMSCHDFAVNSGCHDV
jgi:hypothetical protein